MKYEIERFQKKKSHWKPEEVEELDTLMKKPLTINRILYIGDNADPKKPKRCISLTKNGKSVAFDIEMGMAVAAAIMKLSKDYKLKGAC